MIRLFSMAHILSLFFSVAGPLAGGPDTHCSLLAQPAGTGWGLGIKRGEKEEELVNNESVPNSFFEEEWVFERLQGFLVENRKSVGIQA